MFTDQDNDMDCQRLWKKAEYDSVEKIGEER